MRVDAHLHVFGASFFNPGDPVFPSLSKKNRRRKLKSPIGGQLSPDAINPARARTALGLMTAATPDVQAEALIGEMNEAGVDKALVMVMDWDYQDKKTRITHEEQLKELVRIRDKYPGRFLLFCGIDPRRGRPGVAIFVNAVKNLGYAGLGELLPHFGFYPNDRELCYPLYEKCAELNVPVAANCSILASSHISRYCDPMLWEEVCRDFPEVNICLAHSGYPMWAEEVLALASAKHNIYCDISDWQGEFRNPEPVLKLLRRAMDKPAKRKFMFASDFPVGGAFYSEKGWVEVFTKEAGKYGIKFTEEELNLFFCENVQDFLDRDL